MYNNFYKLEVVLELMENRKEENRFSLFCDHFFSNNRRGQVTIFIIIAVLIIAAIVVFLMIRGGITEKPLPAEIEVVEKHFLNCLEEDTLTGVEILESNAGYIYLPDFEPGSSYMPFSSELNFLGNSIPYWYYVSGNNLERERVPSKKEMENHLEDFIEGEIGKCEFDEFYSQEYGISGGDAEADVSILDNEVRVSLEMPLGIEHVESSAIVKNHDIEVSTELGNLYDSALEVYNYEQENLFLEEYALDTLGLYAPVDGVEISCAPLLWNADKVFEDLGEAIEVNTLALTNSKKKGDYFNVDLPVSQEVRFVTSIDWTKTYEVAPSEGNTLLVNPIGNQPGLGIMGFCYVPYHFVYDLKYPVLVQVKEGEEIFQFPMAVIIDNNNPRESLDVESFQIESLGICENKNTPISVSVFDLDSMPVEAEIYYECFSESCYIGNAEGGNLDGNFPQCVNGFIVTKAEGFEESSTLINSLEGSVNSVYLDKIYELPVRLKMDGVGFTGEAIINYVSEDGTSGSLIYPNQNSLKLSEGLYDFRVQIYDEVNLNLGSSVSEQCVDVPSGFFGINRKKCFEVEFPESTISRALVGGGIQEEFLLDSELSSSGVIEFNFEKFPSPDNLEQIQTNNILFENSEVEVSLL